MLPKKLDVAIEKFCEKPTSETAVKFLKLYKEELSKFVKGKITARKLSDLAVNIFVINDDFESKCLNFNSKILELGNSMDVTHPSWSSSKRIAYVKNLIKIINDLINSINTKK